MDNREWNIVLSESEWNYGCKYHYTRRIPSGSRRQLGDRTAVAWRYVRTPYDNRPYNYDPEWQVYIFDEDTDYAWVNDTRVLAAVRELSRIGAVRKEPGSL